ncbi:hypothetical protein WME76_11775 [Sorangium sp. So ce119]|uniref:hypothetical protein n=1 Tax=Sorangium sp. So ce119 TaxID=3133279 RepID=UPI003F64776D
MVESEGNSRSITLEELAAIAGALEAGAPRDEALAGAGLSVEGWEAARERWLAKLAAQAARGQLRPSQRYLELVGEQKRRAQAKLREARRKPEGPMPVAPEAHLPALGGAPPDGAAPVAAAGVSDEEAARSPWARSSASGPAARPLMDRSPLPSGTPSPLPSGTPSPLPAAIPSPLPAATPTPRPSPIPEPPPTAPRAFVTLLDMRAVPLQDALPFRQGASNAAPVEATAARMDTTNVGTMSALPADRALPFARKIPGTLTDSALPFSRGAPPPSTDSALPFSRPNPPPAADKALPFSRPVTPPADNALPFSRPVAPPAADNALPFSRPAPPAAADNALPFSRPAPPPAADKALPFSHPSSSPPADNALPFSRQSPSPPADNALPFSRQSPSPPADNALPFSRPVAPPAPPRASSRDEAVPRPPPLPTGRWALPFQQPSSGDGSPANTSLSRSAAGARPEVDAEMKRRVERISLAQYARICADVREHPAHVHDIQGHYGLDPQSWTALHAMWHERFQSDPALKARWQALVEQSARR